MSIVTNILKIGQNVCELCHFKADHRHFTKKKCRIGSFVRKKGVFSVTDSSIFKVFVFFDIFSFQAIRLWQNNSNLSISEVKFLHFIFLQNFQYMK